jgi:Domain of unknown function (DUF5666)/Domain of unknown function (DUF4382)
MTRNGRIGIVVCVLTLAAFAAFLGGCGGGMASTGGNNPFTPESSAVTLTITDAPPAGVTVLSFEVTVNGAVLSPGNVQLVASPQKVEVKELETESAFLSTANIPAGTYQSISVNFTNPELTIMNQSGAAIGSCANNSVCHIEPAAAGNISLSSAPFPITLQSGGSGGFQLDVNVANLISNTLTLDFNASGAVSIAQLPLPGQNANDLSELDDLLGTVQSVDATNTKFTLHTLTGDFPIQADSGTEFELEGCAADNFSCLQNGAVVEVDARLMSGGAFIAKKIELEDNEDNQDNELYGVVFKIDDATHFEMVVLGELSAVNNVNLGNSVSVTLNNPSFQVQSDGLSVPSALQGAFENASDTSQLVPGQEVQVKLNGSVSAGSPIALTTNRVRLRMSQFSANVSGAPSSANFNVANLPGLFTGAGVTSIQVQTSSNTNFQNVPGVSALVDEDRVSLRGLLFGNGGSPILVADKVLKR